MNVLKEHLKTIGGIIALLVALIFLQAASYRFNIALGDLMYLTGAVSLTMAAILFGLRMETLVLSSIVSMCLSFGFVGAFTSAAWYVRSVLFDLQTSFDQSDMRDALILYVILPLVIAAILAPPAIGLLRKDDPNSGAL